MGESRGSDRGWGSRTRATGRLLSLMPLTGCDFIERLPVQGCEQQQQQGQLMRMWLKPSWLADWRRRPLCWLRRCRGVLQERADGQ